MATGARRGVFVPRILNALSTARSTGDVARIIGKPTCYVTGNLNRLLRQGYVRRIGRGVYIAVSDTSTQNHTRDADTKCARGLLRDEIVSFLCSPRTVREITDRLGRRSRHQLGSLRLAGRIIGLDDGRYVAADRTDREVDAPLPPQAFMTKKARVLSLLDVERDLGEITAMAGGSRNTTAAYLRDYVHAGIAVKVRYGVFVRADRLPAEERQRLNDLSCWTTERAIASLLREPTSTRQLAKRTGAAPQTIRNLLKRLQDEGRVERLTGWHYVETNPGSGDFSERASCSRVASPP